ncbi:MAG: DegV family protein [Oscillospiraceae bacterium]|nr:DegV family protein [Oscillospiraceae bacterium]
MKFRIVTDSSANTFSMPGVDLVSVPLKIVTAETEYVDDAALDVNGMIDALQQYKGKSGSACPNTEEYLQAFEGADRIFVFTITRNLSGSYSAAVTAAQEYECAHPGAKVWVADTLSVGPEVLLHLEHLCEGIRCGETFETLSVRLEQRIKNTRLVFALKSLTNLARNGRVSPVVAKMAGILGIRLVGRASDEGTLEPLHKCRGEEKALAAIVNEMKERGWCGGAVRIAECQAKETAAALKRRLRMIFPKADIRIAPCTGLCSFYAESGGILVGYEGDMG